MADGPRHPSIIQKIGQPYLFTRHFHNSKAWTPAIHNFPGADAYVNRVMQRPLLPACQGSASPLVSPLLPVFVGAPLEKRNAAVIEIFYVGGLVASMTAVAPIKRVEFLMQSQKEMIKSGRLSMPYKGIVDCFARTIRNEGIISLWRGNTANIIECLSFKALSFPINNYFKSLLNCKNNKDGKWKWFDRNLAADCLSIATIQFLIYPLEYARTRLASDIKAPMNVGQRQFNGLIDVYRRTLKSDGIAGLYRGFNISIVEKIVIRSFVEPGLYAGVIASLKPVMLLLGLLGLQFQDKILTKLILVKGIQVCAGLATYPMDTVCRRMMMTSGEVVKYKSSMDAFYQIIKNEGIESLYKGAGAYIFRGAILGAFMVVTYKILTRHVPSKKNVSAGGTSAGGTSAEAGQPADDRTLTIRWR